MKKIRLLVTSLLILVMVLSTCLLSACNWFKPDSDEDSDSPLGKKMYSFGVLSDIHVAVEDRGGPSDFKRAIKVLQNLGVEFVGITGDIGANSQASELQTYKAIVDANATVPFYACTGNHDATHSDEAWEEYVGHPKNFEMVNNGDVFLFMSLTQDVLTGNPDTPYTTSLDWLQEKLVRHKGARIFVFMHYPITDYAGLTEDQIYGFSAKSTEDDELMETLMNTENVVVFSGHTHYKFECETTDYDMNVFNMPNKDVSLVHVPSCTYPRNSERKEEPNLSQGYVVDVYEKGVVLRGVDLVTGEYMSEYVYELSNKSSSSAAETPAVIMGEKMYSFGVLSDIHVPVEDLGGPSDFKRAIKVLQNLGVEFVGMTGDIGSNSEVSELQTYKAIVDANATVPFYACTGNHDAIHSDETWEEYVGHPKNFEIVNNGDVFLFMSLTQDVLTGNPDTPYTTNLDWLQERLARYEGARIFVFMHYPITDYAGLTKDQIYGFSANSTEDDELMETLLNTENVVVFSGHTHYKFECETTDYDINVFNMPNKNVSLVHVPSCTYPRNSDRKIEGDLSQGYVVDVYENGVVLRGVDLVTGKYMSEYVYELANKGNSSVAETPTVMLSTNEIRLNSTSRTEIEVTLSDPANAVVNITENNDYIVVSPSTLTFTEENYNVPQKVLVATSTIEHSESAVITLSGEGILAKTIDVELSDAGPVEFTNEAYAPQDGDIFTGTAEGHYITTGDAGKYTITFDNFSLTHTKTALYLSNSGAELTLYLKGNNTLQAIADDGKRGMSSSATTPGKIIGIGEGATLTLKAQGTAEALKGDYDITNASVIVEHTGTPVKENVAIINRGVNIIDNGSFSINGAKVELLSSEHGSLTVRLGKCEIGKSAITITAKADSGYTLAYILVNGVQQSIDAPLTMPASGETITIQGVFTK